MSKKKNKKFNLVFGAIIVIILVFAIIFSVKMLKPKEAYDTYTMVKVECLDQNMATLHNTNSDLCKDGKCERVLNIHNVDGIPQYKEFYVNYKKGTNYREDYTPEIQKFIDNNICPTKGDFNGLWGVQYDTKYLFMDDGIRECDSCSQCKELIDYENMNFDKYECKET